MDELGPYGGKGELDLFRTKIISREFHVSVVRIDDSSCERSRTPLLVHPCFFEPTFNFGTPFPVSDTQVPGGNRHQTPCRSGRQEEKEWVVCPNHYVGKVLVSDTLHES